ncbi:MAG: SDR family oxidoreductase [Clostridiales bacterium]|jgi:NAD(P)-dependent dehydrogenase (short-subunit alcohol dehydrogenase family)|nr:SDR family oxidoreductase [Clostridiales bacterium]
MKMEYVNKLFNMDGKKAVITGGNSGIGKGIARSLASLGADITFVGRHRGSIQETEKELADLGVSAKGYVVDVSSREEVDKFFDTCFAENGRLDICVINASVEYDKRLLDATEEEADKMFRVNMKGALFFLQRASEAMKAQKGGNIVIISSVNGLWPNPPQAFYSATKAAQLAMMECAAADLRKFNIRVNAIAPGAVMTSIGQNGADRHSGSEEIDASLIPDPVIAPALVPLDRVGLPEDIGDACACLVSDAFRYMTGAVVAVDGGILLRLV